MSTVPCMGCWAFALCQRGPLLIAFLGFQFHFQFSYSFLKVFTDLNPKKRKKTHRKPREKEKTRAKTIPPEKTHEKTENPGKPTNNKKKTTTGGPPSRAPGALRGIGSAPLTQISWIRRPNGGMPRSAVKSGDQDHPPLSSRNREPKSLHTSPPPSQAPHAACCPISRCIAPPISFSLSHLDLPSPHVASSPWSSHCHHDHHHTLYVGHDVDRPSDPH